MKKEASLIKEYYTVRLETIAPVTLNYKVYAESPEQAIELARRLNGQQLVSPPAVTWSALKKLRATVYNAGTSLVRLSKTLS